MRKNTAGKVWVFVLGSILFLMMSIAVILPTFHKIDAQDGRVLSVGVVPK